ncbi:MAG: nitroreductase family protein [Spirochaetaceae bacterium]|jgi:nitroreductase|nr:nitroreductase family protein [Spirochaetaceae bacterium]
MKKQKTPVGILLLLLITGIPGFGRGIPDLGAQDAGKAAPIINHYGAANFVAGDITKTELDIIIAAGIRSPSARNRQPWHFTVVQNRALSSKIVPNMPEGNILIIISAAGDGKTNGSEILDCALATQSIYLAAQALGLGSRIYTGPMDAVNNRFKAELGLPGGHSAVALVRIGRLPPGVDAASSASRRNAPDRMVTYK